MAFAVEDVAGQNGLRNPEVGPPRPALSGQHPVLVSILGTIRRISLGRRVHP